MINVKNSKRVKSVIFTSKANVLNLLQKEIKKSKIEKLYFFTVYEWTENSLDILEKICKNYHNSKYIIIRSSALGEDSLEKSFAGTYESILNVSPKNKDSVQKAINSVIESYSKKGNNNSENQIIIQNQTLNITTSGVIFTKTPDLGSPYYVINFDDGGSTTGITHGISNNLIKIFRQVNLSKLEKRWKMLLSAIKEIELILQTDSLDIEFGIIKTNKIVIFQVRPLTSIKQKESINIEKQVLNLIKINKKKFLQLSKTKRHVNGKYTIFSDMSDWNPSEIIGDNPNLLDYSLYDYLIMEDAWYLGRIKINYQNVKPYKLMTRFGNKPFVDVRGSFNSLIPYSIDNNLKRKLMSYYLNKLLENPHLHDKVEFDILFTCYDLTVISRLRDLLKHNFVIPEIKKIELALLDHTNFIIKNFNQILQECEHSIVILDEKRQNILLSYNSTQKNYVEKLSTAESLLKDCKKFGSIPFSTIARIAFIATALLNSLVKENYVDSKFISNIMHSVNTPLSEFQQDLTDYGKGKTTIENILKKYGHLRPGTYDITALRYDKHNSYFDVKFTKPTLLKTERIDEEMVKKTLQKRGLDFQIDFLLFVKQSIAKREFLKFTFTQNISDAIELIADAGNELGFSRDEMSNLDLKSIFRYYKKLSKNDLKSSWHKKIICNKKKKLVNSHMVLPPIIASKEDFEIIKYYLAKPNYITEKSITAELVNLMHSSDISLENKIVILENADPGYDWIFSRNLGGLITKYGGVASHMAIRCAELELPAAIGCGETIFEKLVYSSRVLLDCKNKEIVILEHSKHDEFIEERKVLKTLGYIK